jgi:hypothetical protein
MRRYVIPLLSVLAGGVTFVLLVAEGVPAGEAAAPGKRVKVTHTTRSGCPERCKEPQEVDTEVTLSSNPATLADDPGLIEKALDNDGGVQVIRFLFALAVMLTTAATLERLRPEPGETTPPEETGQPVERDPGHGPGSSSGAAGEAEEAKEEREAQTREERLARIRRRAKARKFKF